MLVFPYRRRWIWLCIMVLISISVFLLVCKLSMPYQPASGVRTNMIVMQRNTIKVINETDREIKKLTINCGGDDIIVEGIKPGRFVRRDIASKSPAAVRLLFLFHDDQVISHSIESIFMPPDQELQVLIDNDGKVFIK